MQRKNIEFELQGRVRKYLEYISYQDINSDKEKEILNKLTHSLRKEVLLAANGKLFHQIPFFKRNFSAEVLDELAFSLKQVRFSPEEFIYKVIFCISSLFISNIF